MKATFPGWYPKTLDQLKALWGEATIVPDTNIILHLMRHSPKVRSQLMEVFEQKKDALWIPYQVGAEFQLRRLDVQQQAIDAYDRLTDEITTFVNQAKNRLNQYRAHPVIDIERELSALDVYKSDFEQRMIDGKANHPNDEFTVSFERVTELFVGRVGAKPSPERIAEIESEGKERYEKRMPPGFEDEKKTAESGKKFGDLIIWKEMIEKAKADKRPIIFVTDDGKSDWWYIHRGRKIGPHPALVEEFLAETGQQFHIYELLQFLRYAADTGSEIRPDAVKHIAETLIADSEAGSISSAAERSQMMKVLRAELRHKESELDTLIKSLIELPPKTAEQEVSQRDDTKKRVKARIGEINELVAALRAQLSTIESDGELNEGDEEGF